MHNMVSLLLIILKMTNFFFLSSGLTNMEIFEKDLKMVSGPSMNIAMSSVTMDMMVTIFIKLPYLFSCKTGFPLSKTTTK